MKRSATAHWAKRRPMAATIVVAGLFGAAGPGRALATAPKGTAAFSLNLYRQLEAHNNQVNLVESPYSVAEALAMLAAGSQGRTKAQLDTALAGKGGAIDPVQRASVRAKLLTTNGSGLGTTVSVANALWTAAGYPLNASYLQTLTTQYSAASAQLPFASDPASAVGTINQWASTSTEGRIPKLVDTDSITEVTRVVLTNAVLLHGRWTNQFDPAQTSPGRFTLAIGKRVNALTMHGTATTTLKGSPRIISLGFTGGYEMRIIVPTKSSRASLDSAMAALHQPRATGTGNDACANVPIAIPKWTATAQFDELQPALAGLGITDAFNDKADLTGISPQAKTEGLHVSKVVQVANIDVDETGTVAAAATAILAMPASAPIVWPACPKAVTVDRPFVYVIQQAGGGEILFAGRLDNPVS